MARRKAGRDIDVGRLCQAMHRARLTLRVFRANRRELVRQFVGQHWSEEGASTTVPVNLISLYVSVVGRNLIAKNPRVMLSTFQKGMKPAVSAMQSWANQEIERTGLKDILQRAVTDALFSVGMVKVALAGPAEAAGAGWSLSAGQPFCELVDLDDLVYDVHARDLRGASFIGHRYRVPLDVVRESKWFAKARKELTASTDPIYNAEGDERIGVLGRSSYSQDEFEDMVDLWEIYLPRHRVVLTLADDQLAGATSGNDPRQEALRVQNWLGPDSGPYHTLAMGVVPGNAMPKAPLQDLLDLHEETNVGFRKIGRAIDRLKELTMVAGGATEDGSRLMTANDGDILRVDNPERIKQVVSGGQHLQLLIAAATVHKDLFGYMAGNLDMMGGLSPQAKTLGQDKLLSENASRAVADMQDRTVTFTASVIKALCWYWWHDPFMSQKTTHALPGLPGVQLERQLTPQMRSQGRFEDLDISVDPYSMQHQSPQTRMAALNQVVTQIVLPMMQLLIQQGHAFDIGAYLQKISEYMDMPDLADIITIQEPPSQQAQPGGPGGEMGPAPAKTEREYTRNNVSSQTRDSADRNLVSSMLGIDTGGASSNGDVGPMASGRRG